MLFNFNYSYLILASDASFVHDEKNKITSPNHGSHLGAKQFRRAASELLKYYVVDFVLPTRTDISVGQLINLEIPPAVPGEDKEPKFSSGLHLITDLSWNLTSNSCQLNVRCIKDSLPNEIETTEIDYGETM